MKGSILFFGSLAELGFLKSWLGIEHLAKTPTALESSLGTRHFVGFDVLWQNQQNDCAQSYQSLLCIQWVAKDPSFLHADNKDFDQTFCHFVSFIMRQLNLLSMHRE